MKISYSYGVMDLFHYGHLKALLKASEGADLHVVGLISDQSAKEWLGNIVSNEHERKSVLDNISCVDWVMPQAELDPTENLKKLHYIYPDATITLYRGDDITSVAAREYLKSIGGKVESIDYYAKLSPIEILHTLNSRVEQSERQPSVISTKANTLQILQECIHKATIEKLMIVMVGDLRNHPDEIIAEIKRNYSGKKIVIRSSSKDEDGFESSNAGHYESILGVCADNTDEVLKALEKVYHSYGKDGKVEDDEQILVQSQTLDVKYSGVCFTRDIQRNRPYYVLNYDDTGSTDMVTSGSGGGNTIWIGHDVDAESIPTHWRSLFEAVRELESILAGVLLDIEFAIKNDGSVVIFQVRPLAASYKFGRNASVQQLIDRRHAIRKKYQSYVKRTGNHILSDMAFWNPAEIIGDNPHPLDYSLYRDIITHRSWNDGLISMGYRKVSADLMYQFGNRPYISLENSFMCLIPAALDNDLAKKLCRFYCEKLKKDFSAHDKIEFEIVYSCFDFEIDGRIKELIDNGFSENEISEIKATLFQQTEQMILTYKYVLEKDKDDLSKLEEIREGILAKLAKTPKLYKLADIVTTLLAAIKTYGTPQFSRQARYAFVAKSLASTLKSRCFWTSSDYDAFMATVETVATQFERDFSLFTHGRYSRDQFNEKYGHLRAGTYDIRTPRYDQMNFDSSTYQTPIIENRVNDSQLPPTCIAGATTAIKASGLGVDVQLLFDYMKTSLEQREYFKFIFTKSLSLVIELVALIGERLGFSRMEMSYFDITEIQAFSLYNEEERMREYLSELLPIRKESYEQNSQVILPNVISKVSDLDFIQTITSRPNFITEKVIEGDVVTLDGKEQYDIEGKIVVIEKADPGYDWIFTKGIAGLVTKYGGVASHMAIRCAEFEIPAAIGCGDKIYSYASEHKHLSLDCKNGIIK